MACPLSPCDRSKGWRFESSWVHQFLIIIFGQHYLPSTVAPETKNMASQFKVGTVEMDAPAEGWSFQWNVYIPLTSSGRLSSTLPPLKA